MHCMVDYIECGTRTWCTDHTHVASVTTVVNTPSSGIAVLQNFVYSSTANIVQPDGTLHGKEQRVAL